MSYLFDTYKRFPITFKKGKGVYLYDKEGTKYLDFTSGLAVNILGHNHKVVTSAIKKQSKKGIHFSNLYGIEEQENAAEKLAKITKYDKVFFCNSGAEADEAAIKLAKKHTGRKKFVSFVNGFHGRTCGSLALTGKEKIREPFKPLLEEVVFCEYNNIEELEKSVDNSVAAVFFEVIQGEGGISEAESKFINKIFQLSKKHGFLTICDEIQTGVGRTGKFLAVNHYRRKPDIVCLAKGLAGGLPVGAILANKKVAKSFGYGDHGTTFGGNPLSTFVASEVLDFIQEKNIIENVNIVGEYLKTSLNSVKESYPQVIHKITGKGCMQGIWLKDGETRDKVLNILMEKERVLCSAAGERTLRLLPSLIITKSNVDEFVDKLTKVLENFNA